MRTWTRQAYVRKGRVRNVTIMEMWVSENERRARKERRVREGKGGDEWEVKKEDQTTKGLP